MTHTVAVVEGPADAELISAVRAGDLDAYGELFARHVDAARRLARQLVSAGDVDDLVSETFSKVLNVLQRGGGPDVAFRAYLFTALRSRHVDRIRAQSRLTTTGDLTPFDPGVPFRDTAVEGFENEAAAAAFASLPERWQLVLWHTEVEGQKPADVAVLLGMSANSVSALAYRAREGLRQAFLNQHAQEIDDLRCEWTNGHLGAYVRNGISRRDAAKVEQHLAECRQCTAIYLELCEVNSNLRGILAPLLLGSAAAGYVASLSAPAGVLGHLVSVRQALSANPAGVAVAGVAVATLAVVGATTLFVGTSGHHLATTADQVPPGVFTRSSAGAGRATPPQHPRRAARAARTPGTGVVPLVAVAPTATAPVVTFSASPSGSSSPAAGAGAPHSVQSDPGTASEPSPSLTPTAPTVTGTATATATAATTTVSLSAPPSSTATSAVPTQTVSPTVSATPTQTVSPSPSTSTSATPDPNPTSAPPPLTYDLAVTATPKDDQGASTRMDTVVTGLPAGSTGTLWVQTTADLKITDVSGCQAISDTSLSCGLSTDPATFSFLFVLKPGSSQQMAWFTVTTDAAGTDSDPTNNALAVPFP